MYESIRDLFPEVDGPDTVEKIQALVCARTALMCDLLVVAVRAIEAKYGGEGKEVIHQAFLQRAEEGGRLLSQKAAGKGVQDFLALVERGWAATHDMQRVVDTESQVRYRFTRCLVAEEFNRLGATDIGLWFCESDEPALKGFNPDLRFKRTKTLMEGDETCDHQFSAPSEEATGSI